MDYFVTTQGLENYGAHCESGKYADGTQCWKFKSGTDYIVSGFDRPQDAMAFVASICMENGIGWKEFPAQVQTMSEWESQFDDEDHHEKEYHKFKLEYAKRVHPLTVDVDKIVGEF